MLNDIKSNIFFFQGDSGGPLLVSNGNKISCTYTQIGIVSFGLRQCGTIGFPGEFENIHLKLKFELSYYIL